MQEAKQIEIVLPGGTVAAELYDCPTAQAIWEALPFEAKANRWGDEIYFSTPLTLGESPDAREQMQVGELGFWPTGSAFCIFFGPTPVSKGDEPRAYSPVNPFGRLLGDVSQHLFLLRSTKSGDAVRVLKRR